MNKMLGLIKCSEMRWTNRNSSRTGVGKKEYIDKTIQVRNKGTTGSNHLFQ
jgi:hypothetical protein